MGENVDIKSILSGQGNWKGRQQQIRILQNKVKKKKIKKALNSKNIISNFKRLMN